MGNATKTIEELRALIWILLLDLYEILRVIKDLQIYGNPSIPLFICRYLFG